MDALWWQAAAAVLAVMLLPIGGLAAVLSKRKDEIAALTAEVAALKVFKETHLAADKEMHRRLEDNDTAIMTELRLIRTESSEQHRDLGRRLEVAVAEGDVGRGKLHEKVDHVRSKVDQLIGYHEARDERDRT